MPLAAAFCKPVAPPPWPAVVIVHGSGTSDRTNGWARAVADLFVSRGMAVLLTDKRGSGQSGGDWQSAGFDELADDAIAGVAYLRTREDVDVERIGLAGLSQGGWVVPLAAVREPGVAFVIDLSGATVSYAEQSMLEMTNTAREAGLTDSALHEVLELNRAAGRYALGGPWADYAAAREKAMAGVARRVATGFPSSADARIWQFLRKVAAYDPTAYWSVLEQPVFIAFGEHDEHDNVPVDESVRRIRSVFGRARKTNFDVVVAPGVGHALWNDERKFSPVLTERLHAWLARWVEKPAG